MSGLRIGLQLPVINTYTGAVWGDEVMAVGLAEALRRQPDVAEAEIYSVGTIHDNLDLVLSFYPYPECRVVAGPRQVWWFQAPRLNPPDGPVEEARTRDEVERYLLPLLPLGLAIYGSGWEREPELADSGCLKGRINPNDVPALYSSCSLVLSAHTAWHRNNDVPTSRLWEATCCGAAILSDRVPTAEKLFGDTIAFTNGGAELAELAQLLLDHGDLRRRLANRARERVVAGLTFDHHARRILDFLAAG
ncbi:MAG: glycosyltransferase [Armatimonadetes bacterium]|nr:glycosyltransferase [Armatimonadota bacterium]